MTCFVYVLGSADKGRVLTYVGWTNDLERRLARHNAGTGARSTRGRVWALLYSERFPTREEAMSREWHLKRDRALRRQLALDCGLSTNMKLSSAGLTRGPTAMPTSRRFMGPRVKPAGDNKK